MLFESPQVVEKGWGSELVIVNTPNYCGKILRFNTGAKFSMHFHKNKIETWYVNSGKFLLRWIDTTNADQHEKELLPGESVTIDQCDPHQLVCIEAGEVFEVSTHHEDSDSYRVQKGDSQLAKTT